MFTKDSIALDSLLEHSQHAFCLLETFAGDAIPVKNCKVEEVNDTLFIEGYDFLNNRHNKLMTLALKGFTYITDPTLPAATQIINHFKIVNEMCEAEEIEIDLNYYYKQIPIYQKIISMYSKTAYEDVTLNELKDIWKKYITKQCIAFESYIAIELTENTDNELYRQELEAIQSTLTLLKQHEEVSSFNTKEELVKYWPSLLMPSPCFVDAQVS